MAKTLAPLEKELSKWRKRAADLQGKVGVYDRRIAEEQKRKVVNRIVQDVRSAYWRAVSNDRLIAQLEELMIRVKAAIPLLAS